MSRLLSRASRSQLDPVQRYSAPAFRKHATRKSQIKSPCEGNNMLDAAPLNTVSPLSERQMEVRNALVSVRGADVSIKPGA